jgi:hypothetical protein
MSAASLALVLKPQSICADAAVSASCADKAAAGVRVLGVELRPVPVLEAMTFTLQKRVDAKRRRATCFPRPEVDEDYTGDDEEEDEDQEAIEA